MSGMMARKKLLVFEGNGSDWKEIRAQFQRVNCLVNIDIFITCEIMIQFTAHHVESKEGILSYVRIYKTLH